MPSESKEKQAGKRTTFRETVDGWCERVVLWIVLAILVSGPLCIGAVRTNPFFTTSIPHIYPLLAIQCLTMVALVVWVIRIFAQRPFRLLWPPICWAVFAFVLYAIVRCQTAEFRYIARENLQSVILYAALFFLIVNNLNHRESAMIAAMALIAVALGESCFAIYQFATHHRQVWGWIKPLGYAGRGSGTYIDPDDFAGFTDMVVPLALAYTVIGRLNASLKVLLGYSALVMIAGIVVSQSRGAFVSTGVALFLFCVVLLFQPDYWRRGALALAVLTVAGLVLASSSGGVVDRLQSGLVDSGDGRAAYWLVAEQIFHAHVLWGAGPGSFRYIYPMMESIYQQSQPIYVHNDYLNTLCEWGLAGFALVIAALGCLLAGVARVWPYVRRSSGDLGGKHSSRAAFVLGAALGVLALAVHSVVDFNMQIPANAITAITLMALLTTHWRFATERCWVNPGRFGKVLLAGAVLGAVWFLGQESLRAGQEFNWMVRGLNAKASWEERVAALEKAQKIEPDNYMSDFLLGETYRLRAWEGDAGNEVLALRGTQWLARSIALNPLDAQSWRAYGQCLDWLGRTNEASFYYVHALGLNSADSRMEAQFAYHCMWVRNYALAELWLRRALYVLPNDEERAYLAEVEAKLAEEAKAKSAGR